MYKVNFSYGEGRLFVLRDWILFFPEPEVELIEKIAEAPDSIMTVLAGEVAQRNFEGLDFCLVDLMRNRLYGRGNIVIDVDGNVVDCADVQMWVDQRFHWSSVISARSADTSLSDVDDQNEGGYVSRGHVKAGGFYCDLNETTVRLRFTHSTSSNKDSATGDEASNEAGVHQRSQEPQVIDVVESAASPDFAAQEPLAQEPAEQDLVVAQSVESVDGTDSAIPDLLAERNVDIETIGNPERKAVGSNTGSAVQTNRAPDLPPVPQDFGGPDTTTAASPPPPPQAAQRVDIGTAKVGTGSKTPTTGPGAVSQRETSPGSVVRRFREPGQPLGSSPAQSPAQQSPAQSPRPDVYKLVFSDGRTVELVDTVLIGRRASRQNLSGGEVPVDIAGDRGVSRVHVKIKREGHKVVAQDMNSSNGSTVRNAAGSRSLSSSAPGVVLELGDSVEFGDQSVRLEI